jgi:hypothetical protein
VARSIAQQIIDTLMARAGTIRLVQDYNTDAGARVYHARPALDASDLPCVVIWPGLAEVAQISGASERIRLTRTIVVEGVSAATPQTCGELGEQLVADLQEALLDPTDLRVGGQAIKLEPTQWNSEPRDDGGFVVGAQLTLVVTFVTGYGDPYT